MAETLAVQNPEHLASPNESGVTGSELDVILNGRLRKDSVLSDISAIRSLKSADCGTPRPLSPAKSFKYNITKAIKLDLIILIVVLVAVWGLLTLPIIYFQTEIVSLL